MVERANRLANRVGQNHRIVGIGRHHRPQRRQFGWGWRGQLGDLDRGSPIGGLLSRDALKDLIQQHLPLTKQHCSLLNLTRSPPRHHQVHIEIRTSIATGSLLDVPRQQQHTRC